MCGRSLPNPTGNKDFIVLTEEVTVPVKYNWSGPIMYISSEQNPIIINAGITSTGIYIVTITNFLGCSATGTTSITVDNGQTISVTGNQICEGRKDN